MTTSAFIDAITRLRDAWPREEFPDSTIALYGARLQQLPEEHVIAAIDSLIATSKWRPSIAEITQAAAEHALNLPTTEEAWEIAEHGSLRQADEPVRRAAEYVGGRWAILHGDNIATTRAQFRKAYEGYREQALRDYVAARPALNGTARAATLAALPETTRFYPRPVVARLTKRMSGRELPPPTDEEKADAILVLHDGPDLLDDPQLDPLYAEAERIFAEAGE